MHRPVILVALLAVLCVAPLTAKEEKKPSELFAEKESAFLRAIAARYVQAADSLKKEKLYQYAGMLYREALEYFENERDARKSLGYVRQGRNWVIDEDKKLPEKNTITQGMSEGIFQEKSKERFEEEKEKADLYAGKKYAGLGKWCVKEGLSDQARKAFEKSVRLDTDNEAAREGLGYKKVDGRWLTEKQLKAMQEAKEGKLVNDSPSRVESALGLKFNKMESLHFRIETVFPVEALKDYIKNCETTYAYFLRDVGEEEIKEVWSGRSTLIVLGSQEQWHRYVDAFGGGDARHKEFTKKVQGNRSDANASGAQYEGDDRGHAGTVDGLVHKVAHFLVFHHWNISQAWLHEGFAYYYTVKVLESTNTHCVALGDYNNQQGGLKDWGQSENWKDLVKKEVVEHADPDLRMFFRVGTNALMYDASVKAWSMISWLFDKHRDKFMQWLEAVGHGGRKQEEAFDEVFGWSLEQVDKEWRAFVLETY